MNSPNNKIRFLDLKITNQYEYEDLIQDLRNHLDSGKLIISDQGEAFEYDLAKIQRRSCCIAVNSGTDALILALRLLNLPANTHVITTPFSWIASTSCIYLNNLKPYYVDIKDDLQIDLEKVEKLLKENRRKYSAILVPHLHGNVSSIEHLKKIKYTFNIPIVEDCAQAFGAKDINNELAGSCGDIATFSFNAMKTLGALGDAGAIVFDDKSMLKRGKSLRHSGIIGSTGKAKEASTNCRIDALQASFLRTRLKYFNEKQEIRASIARTYSLELGRFVKPVTQSLQNSNHYCYQILCTNRDGLQSFLQENNIESKIRHEYLIPEHSAFSEPYQECINAIELQKKILCLPMHHLLTQQDAIYVSQKVKEFYNKVLKE